MEQTDERHWEAELYRLRVELLLMQGDDAKAEASFHKAVEVARRQRAKSWELRATVSLCRLWQQQGKREEARQMLAEIYGWFTEGFDTPDLMEAKALLDVDSLPREIIPKNQRHGEDAMRTKPFDRLRALLYRIEGPWPGQLAIVPRPRGGDWLEDEVRSWQRAGLNVIVSLLTGDEVANLNLAREAALCQAYGLQFFSFPIVDRGVPSSRRATWDLVRQLNEALTEGRRVAIHCRQGIGRSALIAACLLVFTGEDPETAFERVSAARGCSVPETSEQREWVIEFARELLAPIPRRL
ncbi:MAG: protein-tyrosine phosphatase family protein [Dehalococcoidia bacterium]